MGLIITKRQKVERESEPCHDTKTESRKAREAGPYHDTKAVSRKERERLGLIITQRQKVGKREREWALS